MVSEVPVQKVDGQVEQPGRDPRAISRDHFGKLSVQGSARDLLARRKRRNAVRQAVQLLNRLEEQPAGTVTRRDVADAEPRQRSPR
jgi:hypothetical protein